MVTAPPHHLWCLTAVRALRNHPSSMPPFAVRAALVLCFVGGALAACDGGGEGDPTVTTEPPPVGSPGELTALPPDSERVSIVIAEDGVILEGRLFGRSNRVGVILSHMQPNDQRAWQPFARRLAQEGYAALTYDFRGHGASQGEVDYEKLDDDLREAVRFMTVDRGFETVYLIGASMGATASLVVAAQREVAGVVAVSPPAEFEGQNALEALPAVAEPTLLIASEGDAPSLSFDELRAQGGDNVEVELYSGSAHGTALFEPESGHAAAIERRILRFLDDLQTR